MIAQRNVLAHEYGAIDQRRIFQVARHSVPELRMLLEPLLSPPPEPLA